MSELGDDGRQRCCRKWTRGQRRAAAGHHLAANGQQQGRRSAEGLEGGPYSVLGYADDAGKWPLLCRRRGDKG
uniref:Uncharacterized protein n=1 Tax=Oryza sativa subsp. japonica TaxID=39947 RepID=Q69UH8_ORYSJ|nr:hypothetical protein [Oryza sativa Japonica Group]